MPQRYRERIGPKTARLVCPNIEAFGPKNFVGQNSVTLNDAPRAGQAWDISSVYYSFPGAQRNNTNLFTGLKLQFNFNLSLVLAGVEVASQLYTESQNSNEPAEETEIPMHVLGSLEPRQSAVLYAGMGLVFNYSVSKNAAGTTFIQSGNGFLVITYDLLR
jgi:hypothetical protein